MIAAAAMSVAKFERFFRSAAGLDVDKNDLQRYSEFLRGQATAKANRREIIEPFDLPITKGLQECIQEFGNVDESIELKPVLDWMTAHPALYLALGDDTKSELPDIVGGLSVALARTFKIL